MHALRFAGTDTQHQFMLSQVYEGLLRKMGEKNSDGGRFYTPRELIRAMVRAVNPREKKVTDNRTPGELPEAIAEKGREVEAVLERLRTLL
ncbi:MAG: N-6 DNA methylase [Rhodocyclales bacterium]|nr:N-6 DNA methylase [Rhodocyclales bacterium]